MRLNENKFSVSRQTSGTLFRTDELSSNPVGRRRHAYVRIIGRLRGENGISEGLTRILLISFFFFSWAYLSSRRCLWCINSEILFRSSFTLRLSSSSSSLPYIFHHPPHPCWYALTLGAILWELVWRCDDRLTMKPIQKTAGFFRTRTHVIMRWSGSPIDTERGSIYIRVKLYITYIRIHITYRDSGPTSPGTSYASARETYLFPCRFERIP